MIWQLIDSSGVGGAERHVATLAQSLIKRNLKTTVVLFADHGHNPWIAQLDSAGLAHRTLNGSFASLLTELKAARPALLHTHGYKAGILGRLAARLAGIPVVSTFHSGSRGSGKVYAYDTLDEWTSVLGSRIVVSEAIHKRLPYPSVLAPSFVATPDAVPKGPLPAVAAFVGRLSEEKAPDLFCEIAAASPPGIAWRVYGDGPMREDLERRYGDQVQFFGAVTDLAPAWREMGLLVMPSRSEGVPLAALEALANGIPVLASRVGGLPTIIASGENGWLFDVGNISEAVALLGKWQARDEEATARLRAACWSRVRAEFSEVRHLPPVLDVYRSAGLAIPSP